MVHLRDTKGLRHLAQLLAHPGREFHVIDLEAADISDAKVSVTGHAYQKVGFSIEASTSRQSTSQEGQDIGYPASIPSRVKVKG
jgi:hypothetical protein